MIEPPTKDEDTELKELRAKEGAINIALENAASDDLRHKVSLNRFRALYKLGRTEKCIKRAEVILQNHPNNSLALLWNALAYARKADIRNWSVRCMES